MGASCCGASGLLVYFWVGDLCVLVSAEANYCGPQVGHSNKALRHHAILKGVS